MPHKRLLLKLIIISTGKLLTFLKLANCVSINFGIKWFRFLLTAVSYGVATVLHANVLSPIYSSIVNKLSIFQSYVYSRSPDIIGVTETWLSSKFYCIKSYLIF